MAVKELLRDVFGFQELRAGQEEVISTLLAGRSALAIFPTGGGKSMCYQLPALIMDGTALIVSPLLALMKDQVDGLLAKGIAAARLDSTLSASEYADVMARLLRGELKLLYVSPEKLGNAEFRKLLKSVPLSMLAVDEAHCISEWGHNFRPDYLKLGKIRKQLGVSRLLALTATATPKVEADIRKCFGIAKTDVVKLSFHRPNLDLRITPCVAAERKALLLERLQSYGKPAIVYVTRQEIAEEVATFLAKQKLVARAYHAGLRTELRRDIQEEFMGGEIEVVVATIAFGMGVDKADIRAVIHYNLPKSLEGYTQEIGRAGRDGKAAVCEMLACADDRTVLENFIFSDTPSPASIRNLLERVLKLGREFDVSLYDLASSCDIRQTVVSTLIAYLEMDGLLEARGVFFDRYRIKLLRPLVKLLAGRSKRETKILRGIFYELDAEWKWLEVNISVAAESQGIRAKELREILDELEAAGDVSLKKSNWRQAYRLKREPGNLRELSEKMAVIFLSKEERELARLEKVLALSSTKVCLTKTLLKHFGETMSEDCGHCDRCRGVLPVKLKTSTPSKVSHVEWQQIRRLVEEGHAALATARQLARFLCGMSSPASMRGRLYRHDAYGLLADLPFTEVEVVAESFFK
jgi:ATP-dependent DNA helicase RecQ